MINFNLSEEQILIEKTAREFAKNELLKGVIERDEQKIWPTEQIKKMANLGFLGMMVNQKWNGGGMDTISYSIAMEEIAAIDAPVAAPAAIAPVVAAAVIAMSFALAVIPSPPITFKVRSPVVPPPVIPVPAVTPVTSPPTLSQPVPL